MGSVCDLRLCACRCCTAGQELSGVTWRSFRGMLQYWDLEPKGDSIVNPFWLEVDLRYIHGMQVVFSPDIHSHPPRLDIFVVQAQEFSLLSVLQLFVIEFFK